MSDIFGDEPNLDADLLERRRRDLNFCDRRRTLDLDFCDRRRTLDLRGDLDLRTIYLKLQFLISMN